MDKNGFDQMFFNIKDFIKKENIIGEPVKVGNITVLPVLEIKMGAAGSNKYTGTGIKIEPCCMVVMNENGIFHLPVKDGAKIEEIINLTKIIDEDNKEKYIVKEKTPVKV